MSTLDSESRTGLVITGNVLPPRVVRLAEAGIAGAQAAGLTRRGRCDPH